MRKLGLFLLVLVLVTVAGGAVYLSFWEPPRPETSVEIVVPNERFAR